MNPQHTPYQKALLIKLFSGNQEEMESAVSSQPLESQVKLRKFITSQRQTGELIDVLLIELVEIGKMVKNDPANQFLRRQVIRCFTATVEGIVYRLKQTALASGEFAGHTFSADEVDMLTEAQGNPKNGKKPRFLPFSDNIKETFRLFSKTFQVHHRTDFGSIGFKCLCATFDLRNKLMHPKEVSSFAVTDAEKQSCSDAAAWFHDEIQKLIGACESSPLGTLS